MVAAHDLVGRTAVELARSVRAGEVSPVEVIEAHLARLDEVEGRVGAYQLVLAEQAREDARALAARDDLADLPLAGVPVAIKDVTDVAGTPTRYGSLASSEAAAAQDSDVVARLRAAGAIVVGKTKLPELALWSSTDGPWGATRNPWNLALTPGGSSGGSAAAVAAGTVPLALASDGLGSVRIPAACCGLFGIKPGLGGGVPVPTMSGEGHHWFGMSEFGPLATTVADAALMLGVVAGRPELIDPAPPPRPLRIGVSVERPPLVLAVDDAYERSVVRAAEALDTAGHRVETADPGYPWWLALALLARWTAGAGEDAEDLAEDRLHPRTRRHAAVGRLLDRVGVLRERDADAWREQVATYFATYDLLLLPALALPPIEARPWHRRGWARNVKAHLDYSPMCAPWNLAQVPAATVPTGEIGHGTVPLAVQLVGPQGHERRVLEIAAQLEQLHPWQRLAPMVETV